MGALAHAPRHSTSRRLNMPSFVMPTRQSGANKEWGGQGASVRQLGEAAGFKLFRIYSAFTIYLALYICVFTVCVVIVHLVQQYIYYSRPGSIHSTSSTHSISGIYSIYGVNSTWHISRCSTVSIYSTFSTISAYQVQYI